MISVQEMPVFVIHYTPLVGRREHLEHQLATHGIPKAEWITEKDIAHYDLDTVYDPSPERFHRRMKTPFANLKYGEYRPLKRNVIEVTIQHIEAYRRILERRIPHAVILEDDVVLERDFLKRLGRYVRQLPPDYDVLYFGAGRGFLHVERSYRERILGAFHLRNVFRRDNCQSRFADSYLISQKAVAQIVPEVATFQLPIDWELNYVQTTLRMNVYWAEPTLSHQGSASGKFKSGLR
jgi:GR25 family glycosyltransferase involved in LPS biosynthesis